MGGFLGQVGNLLSGGLLNEVIDRVIPKKLSQEERARFNQELEQALLKKETEIINARSSIITAEAKSDDPWVSRARPTFLWIMYFVILFNYIFIPLLGMLGSFFGKPTIANSFVPIQLPSDLWNLFTYGYLGYVGFRTVDKTGIINKVAKR